MVTGNISMQDITVTRYSQSHEPVRVQDFRIACVIYILNCIYIGSAISFVGPTAYKYTLLNHYFLFTYIIYLSTFRVLHILYINHNYYTRPHCVAP